MDLKEELKKFYLLKKNIKELKKELINIDENKIKNENIDLIKKIKKSDKSIAWYIKVNDDLLSRIKELKMGIDIGENILISDEEN